MLPAAATIPPPVHGLGSIYEYDENGNQTARPVDVRGASNASAAITYTPFDKPRRMEAEHGPTAYEYDGDRQRAQGVAGAEHDVRGRAVRAARAHGGAAQTSSVPHS
ncbi:hypothetical protein ACMHYB_04785 [Sorangium sp. So ce1128]